MILKEPEGSKMLGNDIYDLDWWFMWYEIDFWPLIDKFSTWDLEKCSVLL